MKRIIYTVITLSLMTVTFVFSAQNGEASTVISDGIRSGLFETVASLLGLNVFFAEHAEAIAVFVRKTAHFMMYFALGISVSATLSSYGIRVRRFVIAVAICCLYAATDEFHQHFVDGRSAQLTDVILDTAGAAAGGFVYTVLCKIAAKATRKRRSRLLVG